MKANTQDEIFIYAPRTEVQRALLAFGHDPSWWAGARAKAEGSRIRASVPVFGFRRRTRFEASVDGVREDGQGLTWWIDRGELRGRGEWWLESFGTGTIVHYFLEVERGPGLSRLSARVRRHRWAIRRGANSLKDKLERPGDQRQ